MSLSVQLDALADEVFDAAAAQARLGSQSRRLPNGEVIWNLDYPDLFFLNGIGDLVAPDWSVEDFEQTIQEAVPSARNFRGLSRDPRTVARLGRRLIDAGYQHDVRLGMVQVSMPSAPPSTSFEIVGVSDGRSLADFEASLRTDGQEHGWSRAMIDQYVSLCHHRAAETTTRYFLAYQNGQPIAHVGLFQHRATAYLHGLYTRPAFRRRGAGSALTGAMSDQAIVIGCDRLTLQCSDDGYLPGYYARLGFRPVGEQHIWTRPL